MRPGCDCVQLRVTQSGAIKLALSTFLWSRDDSITMTEIVKGKREGRGKLHFRNLKGETFAPRYNVCYYLFISFAEVM